MWFFGAAGSTIQIVDMQVWKFIADGDETCRMGPPTLPAAADRSQTGVGFAHIVTMRDGRWLYFRDFMNSALTLEAFSDR